MILLESMESFLEVDIAIYIEGHKVCPIKCFSPYYYRSLSPPLLNTCANVFHHSLDSIFHYEDCLESIHNTHPFSEGLNCCTQDTSFHGYSHQMHSIIMEWTQEGWF
jgi:hypothetical protein